MPEYTSELYNWINSVDNSYSKRYSLDQFKSKMSDSAYAKQMYEWISQNDKSFTSRYDFNAFYSKVNSGKKKVSASGGAQKQQPTSSAGTATPKSQSSASSGKGDGIYKLGINDKATYKKEGGQWYVDWNSNGNFMPLKKGDVQARVKNLEANAKINVDLTGTYMPKRAEQLSVEYSKPKDVWEKIYNFGGVSEEKQKLSSDYANAANEKVFTGLKGKEENLYRIQNGNWQRKTPTSNGKYSEWSDVTNEQAIKILNANFKQNVGFEAAKAAQEIEKSSHRYADVTSKLIDHSEGGVVEYLTNRYASRGFTFEETGMGDFMIVRSKLPGVSPLKISLDNFTSGDDIQQAKNLREYLIENEYTPEKAKEREFAQEISEASAAEEAIDPNLRQDSLSESTNFQMKQTIKPMVNTFENILKVKEVEDKYGIKAEDLISKLSAKANIYKSKGSDVAAGEVAKSKVFNITAQRTAELEMSNKVMINSANELKAKVDEFKSKAADMTEEDASAMAEEISVMQGNLQRMMNDSEIESDSIRDLVDTQAKMKVAVDYSKGKQGTGAGALARTVTDTLVDSVFVFASTDFRNELKDGIAGTFTATTQEARSSDDRSTLNKLFQSIIEMGTIMATSAGAGRVASMLGYDGQYAKKITSTFQWFSLSTNRSYDAISKEVPDMPEEEKQMLSIVIGATVGALEKYGVDSVASSKVAQNYVTKSLPRILAGLPQDASLEMVQKAISADVKKVLVQRGVSSISKMVTEGATEATQTFAEAGIKEAYDALKGKDFFKQDFGTIGMNAVNDFILGAAAGGIVNGITSLPSTATELRSAKNYGLTKEVLKDPELLAILKNDMRVRVANGEITKFEAQQKMNALREVKILSGKVPQGLTVDQEQKAVELIAEKEQLTKEIEGKEPNLVVSKTERINEINEQLKNISTDAVQEQTTTEGVLRQEGSELGLQEVEQGNKEAVAEQGQEEVTPEKYVEELNSTIDSDPETYWSVSRVDLDTAKNSTIVGDENGKGIVTKDGDIKGVFKSIGVNKRGVADMVLSEAVKAGGIKLDNYDGYLTKIYKDNGFRIVSRVPFSEEFAPDGWNKEKHGTPDVVAMVYDPNKSLDIEEKTFESYDDAMNYRDSFVEMARQNVSLNINPEIEQAREAITKLGGPEVVVFNTQEEYQQALAEATGVPLAAIKMEEKENRTDGQQIGDKVFIDASNPSATGTTVFHEAAHWALSKTGVKQEDMASFVDAIRKVAKDKKLVDYLDRFSTQAEYAESGQSQEEFLVELMGLLASDKDGALSTTNYQKVLNAINKLLESIGMKPIFKSTASRQEVVDFVNRMAKGLREGDATFITELENSLVSENASSTIVVPKKSLRKVEVKPDHKLSFVKQDDIIDFMALLKDIESKNQKVWFWVADQLGRGLYADEVNGTEHMLDAGPSFALDPENRSKGIIWASGASEKRLNDEIKKNDYVFIISGSPEKSKLFNKTVFDLYSSKLGDYKKFKKMAIEMKFPKAIIECLNGHNSWESMSDDTSGDEKKKDGTKKIGTGRKKFLIGITEAMSKPNSTLGKALIELKANIDVNELRDGFYRDNGFTQGDVMLVLKATGLGGRSNHSTYERDLLGEVVGVPDVVVNSYDIVPDKFKIDRKGNMHSDRVKQQSLVAPMGIGSERTIDTTEVDQKRNKRISEVGGRNVGSREIVRRTNVASEKLKTLFDRDNIPLSVEEAKEMVQEVIDWSNWYDGIAEYSQDVFGEYAEDFLSLLPLSSQAANSPTTVALAIGNIERIYKGENPIGVAEYYGYVSDFLAGKGIKSDKMYNFFKALTGDKDAVAVDMHVWSLIMGKDPNKKQVNPKNQKEFDKAKEFVNLLSKELGLAPREVQASLWAANILRTGGKPDSYEEYIERQVREKGLEERIQGWRDNGYKPFSEIRKRREAENEATVVRKKRMTEGVSGNKLFNNPLKEASKIAEDYARKNNIDYVEPEKVLSLDSDVSKQIADEYEKMKDNPRDTEVRKAYNAMIKETIDQYNEIVSNGYVVEVNNDEPYSSADDMINDLRENKRMKIFSTESGFGDDPITDEQRDANPLLADSGLKDVNGVPLLANDVFRFVHDFFGHAKWGNGFGPVGEENAWTIHSAMYSPLARRAMTSETRGQNSWVNFSGVNEEAFKLRDKARQLRREGKTEEASALVEEVYGMMKFADQKVGLMPEWTTEPQSNLSRKKRITPTKDEAIKNAMDKYKMSIDRAGDKVAARRSALADLQKGAWWDNASDVDRDAALRELRKKLGLKEVPASKEKRKGNDVTVDEYDALVSVIKREAKAARDKKKQMKEVMQTITEYVREQLKNKKILPRQASAIVGKVNVTNFDSQKSIDKLFEYVDKVAKDATYMEKLAKASQLRKALSRRAKNGRNPLAKFAKAYATLNPKYVEDIDQYIEIARLLNASFERSAVDSKSSEVKWKSEVSLEQIADYLEQELRNHAEIELQKLRNRYEKLTGNSAANMSAEQIQEALRTKPADVADVTAEIKERLEELKQSVDDDAPQSVKDAVNIDPTIVDNRLALDIIDAIDSYLVNGLPGGIDKIMARYDALKSISETNMKAKKIRVFGSRKVGRVTTEYATNINMMIERMFSGAERAAKFMKLSGWNGIVNGFAKATRQAAEKSKAYTTRYKGIKNFNSVENIFERGAIAFLSRTSQAADEFNIRRKLLIESEEDLLEGNDKDIERAKAYRSVFEKLGLYNDDATLDSVMSKAEEFNKDAVKWVTRMWGDVYGDFRDFSLSMRNTMLANDINYTTDKYGKVMGNESKTNPDEDLVSAHAYSKYANVSLNKNEAGVFIERTHSGKLTDGRYVSLDFDTNNMRGYKLALVDMYTAKSIYQLQEFMNSKQFREVVADADDRDLMAKAMKQYVNAIKGKSAIDVTSLNEFQKLLNTLASFGAARALAGVSQAVSQYSTATINTIVNAGILNVDFRAPFNTKVNEFINRSGTATANRGYDSLSGLARADEMAAKISSGAISRSANAVLDTVGKINETMLNLTLVKPDVVAARTAWWAYYTKYCKKNNIKIDLDGDVNKEAAEYAQQMVDRNMDVSDAELKGTLFKQTRGFGGILKNLFFPFASFSMNMKQRLYNDFAVIGTAAVKKVTGATDNMPSNEDLAIASRSLGSIFAEMAVYNGLRYYVASAILESAMSLLDLDDEEKEAMRDEIKAQALENVVQKAIEDLISPSPITNGIVLRGVNYLLDGMDYGVSQKDIDDAVKEVNEKRLNKGDEEMSEAEEELFVENFIAKNQYQFYISDDRTAGMYGIQYERIAETLSMIRAAKTGEYYELGRDGEWHKRILTEDARKKMFLPALLKSTSQLTVREFDQVSNRMFKILKKQSSITPKQKIKYDELKKAGVKIDRAIMQKIKDGASVETIIDFDSYYANLTEAERLNAIEEEKGQ